MPILYCSTFLSVKSFSPDPLSLSFCLSPVHMNNWTYQHISSAPPPFPLLVPMMMLFLKELYRDIKNNENYVY